MMQDTGLTGLHGDTLILADSSDTLSIVAGFLRVKAEHYAAPWVAWVVLVLGLAAIARLWYTSNPNILDRPDMPGSPKRKWSDKHSKYHAFGAAIVAFPVAVFSGFLAGLVVSMVLWTLVEVAQKYPRDKLGGVFELADLFWDYVGAFAGAWLGGLLGTLL